MTAIETVRKSVARAIAEVVGDKEDNDGTANYFETEGTLGDTPDLTIPLTVTPPIELTKFLLTDVKYYLNPANSVTYELYLFEDARADNVDNLSDIVYDSGASMAKGSVYHELAGNGKLPTVVDLTKSKTLYYLLVWSGTPGNTPGYVKVRGRALA